VIESEAKSIQVPMPWQCVRRGFTLVNALLYAINWSIKAEPMEAIPEAILYDHSCVDEIVPCGDTLRPHDRMKLEPRDAAFESSHMNLPQPASPNLFHPIRRSFSSLRCIIHQEEPNRP
jgi:hypothetical protein